MKLCTNVVMRSGFGTASSTTAVFSFGPGHRLLLFMYSVLSTDYALLKDCYHNC